VGEKLSSGSGSILDAMRDVLSSLGFGCEEVRCTVVGREYVRIKVSNDLLYQDLLSSEKLQSFEALMRRTFGAPYSHLRLDKNTIPPIYRCEKDGAVEVYLWKAFCPR
jgi:hypothetical protein